MCGSREERFFVGVGASLLSMKSEMRTPISCLESEKRKENSRPLFLSFDPRKKRSSSNGPGITISLSVSNSNIFWILYLKSNRSGKIHWLDIISISPLFGLDTWIGLNCHPYIKKLTREWSNIIYKNQGLMFGREQGVVLIFKVALGNFSLGRHDKQHCLSFNFCAV